MTELKLKMTETPRTGGGFTFDFQLQRVESDDATEREKLVMRGLSDHIERTIREAIHGIPLAKPKLRRVFIPASERVCIGAFGSRLKRADQRLIGSSGGPEGVRYCGLPSS